MPPPRLHPSAAAKTRRGRVERSPRSDGASTRAHILEVAGALYADGGYSRTTIKAICASARTNVAAVNYHFGGRDGLYEAVLIEAHARLVGLDELRAIAGDDTAPELQFAKLVRTLLGPHPQARRGWAMRVLVQEMLAPTGHIPVLVREAVLPKVQVLLPIVARILGVAPQHPGVQRGVIFAVVPCIVLLVAPRPLRDMVLPAIDTDPDGTIDELIAYALAGLRALRERHAQAAARVEGQPAPASRSKASSQ